MAMYSINISSLKNRLSEVLRKVKKGTEVLVLDRDLPVAKISAISGIALSGDQPLFDELERRGIIQRATKSLDKGWFKKNPLIKVSKSAVKALLKEREEAPY